MIELSWHQQEAARRAHRLRHKAAHIKSGDYIATGKMLCGRYMPPVTVEPEHAHKPENRTCKQCLEKLTPRRTNHIH
jgi:hypothetical protein